MEVHDMLNVQSRVIPLPAERVAAALDDLVGLWPAPPWPALRLDRGLAVGSRGGHGPIRYAVSVRAADRIRFGFDPQIGLVGYHELRVEGLGAERCRVVDTLAGRARGRMRLLWPVMFRWLHEDLMHDLFDNLERQLTGHVAAGDATHGIWSRMIVDRRRAEPAPRPRHH
jgi:hypothetical protein